MSDLADVEMLCVTCGAWLTGCEAECTDGLCERCAACEDDDEEANDGE